MKIAILGSNGFLSSNIGAYLNGEEHEIIYMGRRSPVLDNYSLYIKSDFLKDDIDYDKIINANVIFYAAGLGVQSNECLSSEYIYRINTFKPIEIFNELSKRHFSGIFISFGSYFEIGNNSIDKKYTEDDIVKSLNLVPNDYCISKRLLTRFFSSSICDIKHYHFILPTIYGEDEPKHRLIPYIINNIKNNKLNFSFTSGKQIRQYLYIKDALDIIFLALKKNIPNGIYNIEGSQTLSIKSLISEIMSLYGIKEIDNFFNSNSRYDEAMINLQLNGNKLLDLVDFRFKTTLINVYEKY